MAYDRLSTYKTTWFNNGSHGGVTYQHTNIVSWIKGKITLRSDGWEGATTKKKMNQASRQFGLGFGVFQKNFAWFVDLPNGETVPFVDGMTFENPKLEG